MWKYFTCVFKCQWNKQFNLEKALISNKRIRNRIKKVGRGCMCSCRVTLGFLKKIWEMNKGEVKHLRKKTADCLGTCWTEKLAEWRQYNNSCQSMLSSSLLHTSKPQVLKAEYRKINHTTFFSLWVGLERDKWKKQVKLTKLKNYFI